MQKYHTMVSTRKTAQSEAIPGRQDMVENHAGGYGFQVSCWDALDRFLILGTEGGSYYVGQRDMTKQSFDGLLECIKEDGLRTVSQIVSVSDSGRAPKNDPALFALAVCAKQGDAPTRKAALECLPLVARIGTHLFHFCEYLKGFGGWGRATRRAVSRWYTERKIDRLALDVVKYRQRDGWTHRDVLRKAHPKPEQAEVSSILRWAAHPESECNNDLVLGYKQLKNCQSATDAASIIRKLNLPRECVPTDLLKSPVVWGALFERMPMTAMIRNLPTMTRVKLFKPLSEQVPEVCRRLTDGEALKRARIHPIQLLAANITYGAGHSMRGSSEWDPIPQITEALEDAYYKAFDYIEPTGKRIMLGVDVSGSMACGEIAGIPGLSPAKGAGAMAMATARTEKNYMIHGFAERFKKLRITAKTDLRGVAREIENINFGGTDCALPMIYAIENELDVDAFIVYTDSETWFGHTHPCQALLEYRRKSGIDAKLIVVAMVSSMLTIADPKDSGMLDVVGFDSATPAVIADFIR